MGWENPEIPWRELERRLSGRPAPPPAVLGDGGDSPAWSRKREAYAAARPAPAGGAGGLRRAACALVVQLPRRRVRPGGAGRGSGPARSRGADPHRPRRRLRCRPLRRSGRVHTGCPPGSAPSCHSTSPCRAPRPSVRSPPGSACPTRPAPTCSPSPATPSATPGSRERSAPRTCAAAAKGRPVYDRRRTGRGRRRALADPHRLPQGRGAAGARPRGQAGAAPCAR